MDTDSISPIVAATTPSAPVASALKEATICAVLENYGRCLLKHKIVNSIEELKTKLSLVLTQAMNLGDASPMTLQHIEQWLAQVTVHTEYTGCCRQLEKFLNCVLTEEVGSILTELNLTTDPSAAEFLAVYKLRQELKQQVELLQSKYADSIQQVSFDFIQKYKATFDPTFITQLEAVKACTENR